MAEQVLRGIPRALLVDGWWLTMADEAAPQSPPKGPIGGTQRFTQLNTRFGLLVLLVIFADFLFYSQWVGLSLALFGAVLAAVVLLLADGQDPRGGVVALIGFALLPVVEQVQLLSLLFWIAGLLMAVVWAVLGRAPAWGAGCLTATRFFLRLPGFAAFDLSRGIYRSTTSGQIAGRAGAMLRGWAMPAVVGLVFAALIIAANPVLEGWLNTLTTLTDPPVTLVVRVLFWAMMAMLIWPFLRLAQQRAGFAKPTTLAHIFIPPQPVWFGMNPASVANALGLFNLIFALQTAMDLTCLWCGADLPDGLSHAQYAHRGAYPLVATALLAGVFALISRPYTEGQPRLRRLLALWLGQNILLVISSLYRLDLYVESYGLTYLRIAAAIWMGLVAMGLMLTAWQIWRGKTNLWLMQRNALMLLAVLYACCFVNFAAVIAHSNLERFAADELDRAYICSLGPNAAAEITAYRAQMGTQLCHNSSLQGPQVDGWRDWGFRSWRVQRNLVAVRVQAVRRSIGENSGR